MKAGEVTIAGGKTVRCINVMNKLSASAKLLTSCVMGDTKKAKNNLQLCC